MISTLDEISLNKNRLHLRRRVTGLRNGFYRTLRGQYKITLCRRCSSSRRKEGQEVTLSEISDTWLKNCSMTVKSMVCSSIAVRRRYVMASPEGSINGTPKVVVWQIKVYYIAKRSEKERVYNFHRGFRNGFTTVPELGSQNRCLSINITNI